MKVLNLPTRQGTRRLMLVGRATPVMGDVPIMPRRPLSFRNISFRVGLAAFSLSALALCLLLPAGKKAVIASPPQAGDAAISILGRDTWMPAGSSRILRVVSTEDMFAPGDTPVVSFSPGLVNVNYVSIGSVRDIVVSITVPPTTLPGPQTLSVTDGSLAHTQANALLIIDGTILPPSPAVLAPGSSATLTFAPNPLFTGQTSFSLDLGPDIAVGQVALQADGTLTAPLSVTNTALPGTRSIHLTAGPYSLLGERGFAVDFGPLVNTFHFVINGPYVGSRDILVPAGYKCEAMYVSNSSNHYQGLFGPDEMYTDATNTLFVLNQGGTYFAPSLEPMFISVFDLSPSNFGALKAIFKNIDSLKLGGLLESGTMLPSVPGKLFVSTESYANGGYPGVAKVIYKVDTQTGASTAFFQPPWNFDPIDTDVDGNLAIGRTGPNSGAGSVTVLDPSGNFVKSCNVENWPDLMRLDPLTGKLVINRPGVFPSIGGAETVDMTDCSTAIVSDGPTLDGGSFGPPGGDFGNQFFVSDTGRDVFTLVPVAWNDPDQSVPERVAPFAYGFGDSDGVTFDRDGKHMLVSDNVSLTIFDITRDPDYVPITPIISFQPSSLSFGNVVVGASSTPLRVTVTNSGDTPVTVAAIQASQGFAQSNTCSDSIAPGGSCDITVTYSAVSPGPSMGTITIVDSASPTPQSIPLTANSVSLDVSPLSLDFASLPVGSTSPTQEVFISNAGSSPVSFNEIKVSTGFSESYNCGPSLEPGVSCSVAVGFAPQATGSIMGSLDVTSNDPGGPQSVVLTGTGQDFSVGASPSASAVNAGETATYQVTLTPISGFNAPISLACAGAPLRSTCRVVPFQVTPDGTNPTSATVTVTTTADSIILPEGREPPLPGQGIWWLGILCLVFFAVRGIVREPRMRAAAQKLGFAILLVILAEACGGSGAVQTPTGTPRGTYTVRVTASSGTLSHTSMITLTVR
jgi:Protein of unknown function (DUF1573)/HYDIN/CFA65/VesB-like, Ig-like domain